MPYYTKRHILFYVEKSELTELFRARDASCPKGKKMGYRKNLTNRDFSYSNKYNENILFNK